MKNLPTESFRFCQIKHPILNHPKELSQLFSIIVRIALDTLFKHFFFIVVIISFTFFLKNSFQLLVLIIFYVFRRRSGYFKRFVVKSVNYLVLSKL
jgi:hypothetical protein